MRTKLNTQGRSQYRYYLTFSLMLSGLVAMPVTSIAAAETVEFPKAASDKGLFVSVTIDGAEHLCLIDSGASHCIFDESLRSKLGQPTASANATLADGGRMKLELFESPVIKIKTLDFQCDSPVTCMDFKSIRKAVKRDVDCVLGVPCFQKFVIRADFDRGQLSFLPQSTKPQAEWGDPVDVSLSAGGSPIVKTRIGKTLEESLAVDTGCAGTVVLTLDVFSKLTNNGEITDIKETSRTMPDGRSIMVRRGILSTFRFRNIEHENSDVEGGSARNLLGLKYLRRYCVTFDLARNKIYFATGKSAADSDLRSLQQ